MWETLGGALENNETPEECIRREIREEVNCRIFDLKLSKVYVVNEDNTYILIVYTGKINEDIQFNLEIEQVRWVGRQEVEQYDFCGNDLQRRVGITESIRFVINA